MKFLDLFKRQASPYTAKRAPLAAALEPRMLFDGAIAATAAEVTSSAEHQTADPAKAQAADDSTQHASDAATPPAASSDQRHEIVFVDGKLQDAQQLIAGLPSGTEVVVLDSNKDGLQQIADYLKDREGIDAIHILSHGADATVRLGNTLLDQATLASRANELATIGQSLTNDGDILLYGCDVASTNTGMTFIQSLAQATGADVAASNNTTGAANLGGDWVLEKQVGTVETINHAVETYSATLANGTLTFNSAINAATVQDGQGGSTDLSGIAIQISNISDANGTPTNTPVSWQDNSYLSSSDPSFSGLTDENGLSKGMSIKSADGSEFQINGFRYYNWGETESATITVAGYRNGVQVALMTFEGWSGENGDYTPTNVSLDSSFDFVDEVRLYISAGGWLGDQSASYHTINNIVIADGIVPPTAPSVSATAANPTFTENGSAVDLFSAITAATNDSGQTFSGATLTVTNVSNGAAEMLSIGGTDIALNNGNSGTIAGIGNYSVSVSAGTATVTLSGMTRDNTQMGTLIDGITYRNTSDDPGSASRVVTITQVTDSGGSNNTAAANIASTVTVTPVNDAPTLTATGGTPTYTENGSAVDLFSGVSIGAVESGQTITGMTLSVSNLANGSSEILRVDGTDIALTNGASGTTAGNSISYSVSLVGGTASITLTKVAGVSTAVAQTVVDGMSYRNSSDTPSTATRVVTLTGITDNGGTANGGVNSTVVSIAASVAVSSVNDASVVTATGGSSAFTEGGSSVVIDAGLTLSDVDSSTLNSATVSISGNFQSGADVLAFTNDGSTMGNITANYNAGTGVMTLTSAGATATLAQWQAALRAVTYSNGSDAPSTTNRTISFVVNDGQTDSSATTKTVSVAAVNDAPQVTAPATINFTEDMSGAVTGISFSDADAGSASVTVTLSVASGSLAASSGGGVTVGGSNSALTLTGSIANINSFISGSNVSFVADANSTANVTLTASINDGGNTGSGGAQADSTTVTLQVAAVNDAPSITAPGSIVISEDAAGALTGISFSDVDAGTGPATVTLSVPSGSLAATSGSGVTVGGTASALTLSGSISDINAFIAASGVRFTTASNATANVTLTVDINDGGNTGTGGALTDSQTVTLMVTAVNDAPVNSMPAAQNVDQDANLVFNSGNGNLISISDVDAGGGTLRATLTASNGLITLSGTTGLSFLFGSGSGDGTMTFEGTAADINNALNGLIFSPTAGYNGAASLQITTNDLGNSGSGGAQSDTDTLNITVNSLNPRITDVSSSTANGTYRVGDTITITTTFNQAVTVDTTGGTPTLLLETGINDRNATYVSGSGSNTLTFSYTVQAGDLSSDLGYQSTAALALNGATIRNVTSNDAVLTLPTMATAGSLGANKAIVIDGVAATVSSVAVPANGTYVAGQNLDFTVNLSESVIVDTNGGTPRIAITLNTGGTVYASYLSGSGTGGLVFRLTVASGQLDSNGISICNSLEANGGSLRDAAGNNSVTTLNAVGSTAGVLIDAVAPEVSAISLDATSPTNASSVTFTVTLSEDVSGVDIGDFSLATTGSVNATLQSLVQIDPRTYRVTVDTITGLGNLGLNLNTSGTGIVDSVNNAISGAFVGQSYTIGIPAPTPTPTPTPTPAPIPDVIGDPEFRANPPSLPVEPPSAPLQPMLPPVPPLPTQLPLLPPSLFEVPTLGSGIPTLGNIFINNGALAPSFIAQVFASSSSDSGGDGSGAGFLGFGGGDGGVFGSSTLSGIFGSDPMQESEQLEVFDGKKWGSSEGTGRGGSGVFGAPTLGQQLHELHESEQRQVHEIALALGQFDIAKAQA